MKKSVILLPVIAVVLLFTSCSHRLVGTWNISKYETVTPDKQGVAFSNIGTMTFYKNGTGTKQLSYSILGLFRNDDQPFTWKAAENLVTISGNGTDLAKTWIQVENKKKFQQWKSTDGSNEVQVLELTPKND
jgi:hypothetical protein